MKIYIDVTRDGRVVRKFAHRNLDGAYRCEPPSSDKKAGSKLFHSLEEAAKWLDTHPGWGIWAVAPDDARPTMYNRRIVIDLA